MDETGASMLDMMRNYRLAVEIFQVEALWQRVEALDGQIPWEGQVALLTEINRLLERGMFWLQRARPASYDFQQTLQIFRDGVATLGPRLKRMLPASERQKVKQQTSMLRKHGVPKELAAEITQLGSLFATMDPILVANEHQRPLEEVTQLYFHLDDELRLSWLRHQIGELPHTNLWQSLARSAARDDFHVICRGLLQDLLNEPVVMNRRSSVTQRIESWQQDNLFAIQRYQALAQRIETSHGVSMDKIVVGLKELQAIVRATCTL